MSSAVRHITFDTPDPYRLAQFWSALTGHPVSEDDHPGDPEALVVMPEGPGLLFVTVDDPKTVKNRVHLDLQPDTTRDAEVERAIGLGATLIDDRRGPEGRGWVVLADPDGNEFCIERGTAG